MNQLSFQTDSNGRVTEVNEMMLSVMGCSSKDLIGHSILEFLEPAAQQIMSKHLESVRSSLVPISFTLQFRRKSGEFRSMAGVLGPLPGNQQFIGVMKDVTEANRDYGVLMSKATCARCKPGMNQEASELETQLRGCSIEFSDLLKMTPDGTIAPNSEGNLGYLQDELSGQPLLSLISAHSKTQVEESMNQAAKGNIAQVVADLRTKSGDTRRVMLILCEDLVLVSDRQDSTSVYERLKQLAAECHCSKQINL